MEKSIAEIEQRSRSNTRRIEVLEEEQKNIHDLVTSVALIAQKQESMESHIQEIREDVKTLAGKPNKRWDTVINTIISVSVGAIVGALMALIMK